MTADTERTLLNARFKRAHHVEKLSRDRDEPVVLVKANMPGEKKNPPHAHVILNVAVRLLFDLLEPVMEVRTPSRDGDYHVMVIDGNATALKRLGVYLEDTHRLGRLFDIDVYENGKKLSRTELGRARRSCLICGGDVTLCRREGRHRLKTLRASIEQKVHGFLLDALSEEAAQALRKELYMHPCFALVGPGGSGRHTDMNISHFLASIEALKPYFRLYLSHGVALESTLHKLRSAGQRGEAAMMKATGGVNTHKGAHFIFGIVLPVFMHSVLEGATLERFKENLATASGVILKDDFKGLSERSPKTKGEALYQKRGVRGVRGEALSGFRSVFEWYPAQGGDDLEILMRIMARLEDTTLPMEAFETKAMKNALRTCEAKGFEGREALYEQYRHLSPGGAADMLALVYFLRSTDHLLKWTP